MTTPSNPPSDVEDATQQMTAGAGEAHHVDLPPGVEFDEQT